LRAAFAHSHEMSSGTVEPTALEIRSTQALVSLKSYLPRMIGIQIWMPRLPVVLG
jgi:hypothetical protein